MVKIFKFLHSLYFIYFIILFIPCSSSHIYFNFIESIYNKHNLNLEPSTGARRHTEAQTKKSHTQVHTLASYRILSRRRVKGTSMNFELGTGSRRKRGRGSRSSKPAQPQSHEGSASTTDPVRRNTSVGESAYIKKSENAATQATAQKEKDSSSSSSGLSFFDAAEERHKKRRQILTGNLPDADESLAGNAKPNLEQIAIPLQTSTMFTGAVKYEDDIDKRPDEVEVSNSSIFEAMPVESFGAAMLRGMGWAPGQPVGGSVKAVVEPFIAEVRGGRLGVGAAEAMDRKKEDDRKSKDSSREDAKETMGDSNGSRLRPDAKRARTEPSSSWVRSGIRVRIVDELAGSKWYGKKGVVQDVLPVEGSRTALACTVLMDDGNVMLNNIQDKWLSTALPKKGGRVIIVLNQGKSKSRCGLTGTLIKRDKRREQATVQLAEDSSVSVFSYDEVSELVFS